MYTVVSAHPSLPRQYWQDRLCVFRRSCLGAEMCVVFASAKSKAADAFALVEPGNVLAWLCVSPAITGRGIGSSLMAVVKHDREQLHTWVLQENLWARYFLQEQGFVERERQPAAGGQHRLLMQYQSRNKSRPAA
ncbi:putative acetyltransferase [Microbulbifer aggregans]|uniref:Putative acetyltransferase n=1 Tax=Microbulbifer aggregans TaxID=1769779 RepID=A0A1C9W5H3_9GAMM|nr:GNAT family N-acetyltransferase [Microbulbifer aggregans]AOS96377.1 putative acetyltransferase [Microbulbifer aggregans]